MKKSNSIRADFPRTQLLRQIRRKLRVGRPVGMSPDTKRGARHFGHKAYLVFDVTFTHFVGFDFNGKTTIEGFRREALDPKRKPPEAKDE